MEKEVEELYDEMTVGEDMPMVRYDAGGKKDKCFGGIRDRLIVGLNSRDLVFSRKLRYYFRPLYKPVYDLHSMLSLSWGRSVINHVGNFG